MADRSPFELALRRTRAFVRGAALQVAEKAPEHSHPSPTGPLPPAAASLGLPGDCIVALSVSEPVTLYRLVWHDPPEPKDFRSNLAKSKRPYRAEATIIHAGLSMYDSPARALARALKEPKIVAAVELLPDRKFYVARTFPNEGHYTVWGDHDELCATATVA